MDTTTSAGRHRNAEGGGAVSPLETRLQLERILQSRAFRNSERLRRFLKFAIECSLGGTTDQLKESILGRVVFDRGDRYDPRTDSIVRVESQRLRKKLHEYYLNEGREDPVSIAFRPGSYVPAFSHITDAGAPESPVKNGWSHEVLGLNPQTIAVLPFYNQCTDPEQEYFCDGITDDIIHALSRIPGLNVIGHTSVFALKGTAVDARQIGTRLSAGTIVEGSVRKSNNSLRIFVEMLDAATGKVLWTENYDRTTDAVFTLESEIAQSVARVLQMSLAPPVSRRLIRGAPNMDAYSLYLQGRHAWNRMSVEGYIAAAKIFEQAILLFPSYASPYAGLADAQTYLALWGGARPCDVFPKAREAALQALKLDPFLADAYTALAAATAFFEWKWDEAVDLARRAIELEPSYAFGQHILGYCFLARGDSDEARTCLERAVQLDPLSVRAHRALGWALYLQRRPSTAEKWLQAALLLHQEPAQTRYLLAHVYLNQSRFAEALEQAQLCQVDPPDPLGIGILGACLAHIDQRDEALEMIAELAHIAETGYVDPYAAGQVQIALNNNDLAIDSIRKSLEEKTPAAVFFLLDPELDPLRSDPRFGAMLSRQGG